MSGRHPVVRWGVLGSLLLALVAEARPVHAGAITFSTALPVTSGHAVFRLQPTRLSASGDPQPGDRSLDVIVLEAVLAYGVTGRLTLFGMVPIRDARLSQKLPSVGRTERRARGFGDARVLARYTVVQRDDPGRTVRLAPFVGFKAPTGADDRSDALGLLPPPLQPGSGSWDLIGGLAFSHQTLGWEVDAALAMTKAGRGDWFDPGDVVRCDFSWQRRLAPRRLGEGVPSFLYVIMESNLVWQERTALRGVEDPASGGTRWFLAPGLQYVTRRFVLEGVVQIPVVQNLGTGGLETDFIVSLGMRIYL